jgi:hypothetical protein
MTTPSIDYQAVLADLEAKRDQLDAAIRVVRTMLAGPFAAPSPVNASDTLRDEGASGSTSTTRGNGGQAPGIQSDTFFGMSTSGAIRKYLSMMKRPQSPRTIADALHAGGQSHALNPKVAYTNTYTALTRMQEAGEAVKIKTGDWGLAEWYNTNRPKGDNE